MTKNPNVKKSVAAFLFLLAGISGIASAGPKIEGWSNSKTKDDKTMFLVKPGEKITFSVQAEGAANYEWTVNKKVAKGKARFAWTVPDVKGIWEIHVKAGAKDGEAHAEWVVSTLTKKEAPTFFDYFTDKQYSKRKGKDPWGRPLPKWSTWAIGVEWTEWQELWEPLPGKEWSKKLADPDCSGCFVQAPSEAPKPGYKKHPLVFLHTKTEIEYGTWKFRYRFPNGKAQMKGGKTHLRFYYAHSRGYYGYSFWYAVACDGFQGFRVGSNKFDNDEKFPVDDKWHELILIRTKDSEIYCFIDGKPYFRGKSARKTWKSDVSMYIGLARFQPDRYPKDTLYVDGVEAYEGRYLFPTKRVELVKGKGISIGGNDVSLKEIVETLKTPKIFRYDRIDKHGVCATRITVEGGADLVLNRDTFRFDPAGGSIHVKPNGTLRIRESSIANASFNLDRPFGVSLVDTRLKMHDKVLRIPLPAMAYGKWEFDGVTISGADTEFILHGDTTRLNVYNSDFGAGGVKATGKGKKPGVLGLVNCKFAKLTADKGAGIATKYYLDICVVDTKGKPIVGAKVSVRNEVDDFKFPAENCKEFQPHGGGDSSYLSESVVPRKISYTTKRKTTTGADGHTPRPKDAENTLVLTDFVRNKSGKKEFKYTITIEVGGKTKVIKGVNPGPEWLRADPNKPAYTITAVLDGKTVTEADLKK